MKKALILFALAGFVVAGVQAHTVSVVRTNGTTVVAPLQQEPKAEKKDGKGCCSHKEKKNKSCCSGKAKKECKKEEGAGSN